MRRRDVSDLAAGTVAPVHDPEGRPHPDEWVITGTGLRQRCDLVPTLESDEAGPIPVRVSEADSETC